jgi:hypothetical protein
MKKEDITIVYEDENKEYTYNELLEIINKSN